MSWKDRDFFSLPVHGFDQFLPPSAQNEFLAYSRCSVRGGSSFSSRSDPYSVNPSFLFLFLFVSLFEGRDSPLLLSLLSEYLFFLEGK